MTGPSFGQHREGTASAHEWPGRGGPRWLRGHPRGSSTGVSAAGAARGRLRPCTVPVPSEHPALQWMGKCRPWPRSPFSTHKRSPEIIKEFRGTTTENLAREKDFFFFSTRRRVSDTEERSKRMTPRLLLPTTPLLAAPFLRSATHRQRQSLCLAISNPDRSLHARCCFLEVTFSF